MLAWLRLGLALSLALLAPGALAPRAQASCAAPPFELLWSYPTNGATDVPINARFWFLFSLGPGAKVSLDGTALTAERRVGFSGLSFAPGELLPNHAYTLRVEAEDQDPVTGQRRQQRIDIGFTTSSSRGAALNYPEILNDTREPAPAKTTCPKVVAAQDCFDTGQNTDVQFPVRYADRALAFLVVADSGSANLWPASCGTAPLLRMHEDRAKGCYAVSSIGPGGFLSEPDRRCVGHPNGDRPAPVIADASIGAPPAPDASTNADAATLSDTSVPPVPTTLADAGKADAMTSNFADAGTATTTDPNLTAPQDETEAGCSAFPFARQTQSLGWWALLALAIARLLQRVRSHGPARHVLGRVSSRLHKRLYERASS